MHSGSTDMASCKLQKWMSEWVSQWWVRMSEDVYFRVGVPFLGEFLTCLPGHCSYISPQNFLVLWTVPGPLDIDCQWTPQFCQIPNNFSFPDLTAGICLARRMHDRLPFPTGDLIGVIWGFHWMQQQWITRSQKLSQDLPDPSLCFDMSLVVTPLLPWTPPYEDCRNCQPPLVSVPWVLNKSLGKCSKNFSQCLLKVFQTGDHIHQIIHILVYSSCIISKHLFHPTLCM